jgi:hypothetical protein
VAVYIVKVEVDGLVTLTVEAESEADAARVARRRAEMGDADAHNLTYECVAVEQVQP